VRGSQARVAINVKVYDVESGEVVCSVKTDGTASAGGAGGAVNYKHIAFGGDVFFRTPLGRATEEAIADAVSRILRGLPVEYWTPLIADTGPDFVVINGGENVRVDVGDIFTVREPSRNITDPATGNVIENVAGAAVGKVRVTEVKPMSAHAVLISGAGPLRRGQVLEAAE